MKQGLQLRMSQHLALTPQLQQSIRLLQLSTLELNQEIEQLLADNPLLERADSPFDSSLRVAGDARYKPAAKAASKDRLVTARAKTPARVLPRNSAKMHQSIWATTC